MINCKSRVTYEKSLISDAFRYKTGSNLAGSINKSLPYDVTYLVETTRVESAISVKQFISAIYKLAVTTKNIIHPKVSENIIAVNLFLYLWAIRFFRIKVLIDGVSQKRNNLRMNISRIP